MFDLVWLFCWLKSFPTTGVYHINLRNTAVGCPILYRHRKKQPFVLNFQGSFDSRMLNQHHSLWGSRETPRIPKSFQSERSFLASLASSLTSAISLDIFFLDLCLSYPLENSFKGGRRDGSSAKRTCCSFRGPALVPSTHMADHNH